MSATITIPESGPCPESTHDGLSDELAMSYGRRAAMTLSDGAVVTVVLSNGHEVVIGLDEATGELTIEHPISMDVIRRCGGFREWANDVVIGPIL